MEIIRENARYEPFLARPEIGVFLIHFMDSLSWTLPNLGKDGTTPTDHCWCVCMTAKSPAMQCVLCRLDLFCKSRLSVCCLLVAGT